MPRLCCFDSSKANEKNHCLAHLPIHPSPPLPCAHTPSSLHFPRASLPPSSVSPTVLFLSAPLEILFTGRSRTWPGALAWLALLALHGLTAVGPSCPGPHPQPLAPVLPCLSSFHLFFRMSQLWWNPEGLFQPCLWLLAAQRRPCEDDLAVQHGGGDGGGSVGTNTEEMGPARGEPRGW